MFSVQLVSFEGLSYYFFSLPCVVCTVFLLVLQYKTYIVLILSCVIIQFVLLRLFCFCFQFYLAPCCVYLVLLLEYLCFVFILYCCSVTLLFFLVCLILKVYVSLKLFVGYLCCSEFHCLVKRFAEIYVFCAKLKLILFLLYLMSC